MTGDTMDCIYLNCRGNECHCHAQPLRKGEVTFWYKPSEEELKDICKESKKWSSCPRFEAFEAYQESEVETE